MVGLLQLAFFSASALSKKRPAWLACGREGGLGNGFSFTSMAVRISGCIVTEKKLKAVEIKLR